VAGEERKWLTLKEPAHVRVEFIMSFGLCSAHFADICTASLKAPSSAVICIFSLAPADKRCLQSEDK
jgi:hypothetical protein